MERKIRAILDGYEDALIQINEDYNDMTHDASCNDIMEATMWRIQAINESKRSTIQAILEIL